MPVISYKAALLWALSAAAILLIFTRAPIPQAASYHRFADTQYLFGIPNCRNVVSNIPFVLIGLAGLFFTGSALQKKRSLLLPANSLVFFIGIFFTGFGSAWYHLSPSTASLVWDRLPMTISFMAFFSILIGECISVTAARQLLFPLVALGILSVLYWQLTESKGRGDLRPYILVQFLPMLLIPLMLLLYKAKGRSQGYLWLILLTYAAAKVFELLDLEIFTSLSFSGHTLKHVVAAGGPLIFLKPCTGSGKNVSHAQWKRRSIGISGLMAPLKLQPAL